MDWGGDVELALIALAAMVSPTTLSFSVLALVLGDRPLRTGWWFYLGALSATLAIGVLAAFVIGNGAASHTSTPKTWVAVVDVVAGVILLIYAVWLLRRPPDAKKMDAMVAKMSKVASSPAVAVVGAGAVLANPGGFIPLALKAISEQNPNAQQYIVVVGRIHAHLPAPAGARAPDAVGRARAGPSGCSGRSAIGSYAAPGRSRR